MLQIGEKRLCVLLICRCNIGPLTPTRRESWHMLRLLYDAGDLQCCNTHASTTKRTHSNERLPQLRIQYQCIIRYHPYPKGLLRLHRGMIDHALLSYESILVCCCFGDTINRVSVVLYAYKRVLHIFFLNREKIPNNPTSSEAIINQCCVMSPG